MGYALPILTDYEGEFTNWIFLQTAHGSRVLLVFDQGSTLFEDFVGGYERVDPPGGRRPGILVVDVPTLLELVKLIEQAHPELFQEAVLIHESDPSFGRLLSAFVEQADVDVVIR
jgi:hypothetical protein